MSGCQPGAAVNHGKRYETGQPSEIKVDNPPTTHRGTRAHMHAHQTKREHPYKNLADLTTGLTTGLTSRTLGLEAPGGPAWPSGVRAVGRPAPGVPSWRASPGSRSPRQKLQIYKYIYKGNLTNQIKFIQHMHVHQQETHYKNNHNYMCTYNIDIIMIYMGT